MNEERDTWPKSLKTACIFVAVLAMLPMIPALFGDFVLDDNLAIVESECVTGQLDVQKILGRNFWCDPPDSQHVSTWRPWPVIVWWFLWQIGDQSPLPFHLMNVILHVLCSLFVVLIAPRFSVGKATYQPVIAGSLFAVMPIHSDAVASIVGGADIWSLAFGLIAVHQTLSYMSSSRKPMNMVYIFTALALSMLSKESGLIFAVVVPTLAILGPSDSRDYKRIALLVSLSALVVIVYLLFRSLAVGEFTTNRLTEVDNILVLHPWYIRLPVAFDILWRYLRLASIGYPLSANYSTSSIPIDTTGLGVFIGGIIFIGLIVYGVIRRKDLHFRFLVIWFVGSFLFISNVFSLLPTIFAERLFYGPSASLCLLVSSLLVLAGVHKRPKVFVVLGTIYICACGILAGQHANAWRTEDAITRVTVENTPMSARGHIWRTLTLGREQGDPTIMERHARRAVTIIPDWGRAHALLASSLDEQSRPREALVEFQRAMELAPYDDEVADLFIQFLLHYGHQSLARDIYLEHGRARGGVPATSVTVPPGLDRE